MMHKRQVGISAYLIAVLVPALFMAVALSTMVQKSNLQIETLGHELAGLDTLSALYRLQSVLQELRSLVQFEPLYDGPAADIERRRDSAHSKMRSLIDELTSDTSPLPIHDVELLNQIKTKVLSLEQQGTIPGEVIFAEYTQQIKQLLSFIRTEANHAYLTRDSELNAHYRVTKVVENIPALSEHVAQLQSMPIRALSDDRDQVEMTLLLGYRQAQTMAEWQQLLVSNRHLKNDDTSDAEGDEQVDVLNAQIEKYMQTVSQLDLYNLLVSNVLDSFFEAESLINQLSQLQQHNIALLKVSLQQRLAGQIKQRNRSAVTIVLAILATLLGVGWFYRMNNRAFKQLAESEYLLTRVLDAIPVRVFWKDLEGDYLGCNDLFAQDAGKSPAEIVGRGDDEMPWTDQAGAHQADDLAVMQSGVAKIGYEEQSQNSDGEAVWWEKSKIPLLNGEGAVVGLLCVFQDITERKRSELNLIESEKQLRTVVDTMADGLIVFDEEGTIKSFNYAAEKIFGYFSEQVIEHNISALIPGLREKRDHQNIDNIVGSRLEMSAQHCSGKFIPIELSISVMEMGGRLYTSVVRDITERSRNEKLKNEFVSTVSHELRTPLTSIRGSLGLVLGGVAGVLPEKALNLLQLASNNTERLLLLINDILDIQKIEAGEMPVALSSHGVDELITTILANNQVYAEQHGVSFQLGIINSALKINVDAERLNQVMSNLLSNAAKFSPRGAVVEVMVKRHGGGIRISVADQGEGIPLDFQDKLFDKFTQCDSSDIREKGGTGLGMSIIKALMEKMGGEISYDTTEGKGSTFHVDLKQG